MFWLVGLTRLSQVPKASRMKRPYLGVGFLTLLLLQACGDSTSSPVPDRLVVSPFSKSMVALGETEQYSARLEDKKGKEITGVVFTWSTSNSSIATITPSGLATGMKAGSVGVRASAEGITGSATLNINPIPDQMTKTAGDVQVGRPPPGPSGTTHGRGP